MERTGLYPAASREETLALYGAMKRAIDIVVGSILLVVASPLIVLIGLAIWVDSGIPIIYECRRLGRFGQPITVLKFRTMRNGSHHHLVDLISTDEERRNEYQINRKLRNDPRRTRVGGFLRKTSLDELPQLLNVVRGDMSLIGPRPYFADEMLDRPEASEILSVRPGITGLWQINGRSERTFEERVGFDLEYLHNRGFRMDARIVVGTVAAVISGRGAY